MWGGWGMGMGVLSGCRSDLQATGLTTTERVECKDSTSVLRRLRLQHLHYTYHTYFCVSPLGVRDIMRAAVVSYQSLPTNAEHALVPSYQTTVSDDGLAGLSKHDTL